MAVDVASVSSSVYYCHSSGVTNNFCRICATNDSGNLFSIFSKEGELWDVAEKIGRCLPIIVLPTDTLPLHICVRCLMKLNASYELVITALNSEAKLKSQFELEEDSCMQLEELGNQQSLSVQIKQEESDDVKKEELNSVDGSSPSLEKKVENSHLLEDVSDRNHKHLELL